MINLGHGFAPSQQESYTFSRQAAAGRGAGECDAIAIGVTVPGTIWSFLPHADVRLRLGPPSG